MLGNKYARPVSIESETCPKTKKSEDVEAISVSPTTTLGHYALYLFGKRFA